MLRKTLTINKESKRWLLKSATFSSTSASLNSLDNFKAANEPIFDYKQGSDERKQLKETLTKYMGEQFEIPIVIGDEEIRTQQFKYQLVPFDHKVKLAKFYYADEYLIQKAIDSNLHARAKWDLTPFDERANIFLKTAEKIQSVRRSDIVAATMLGQGKTVFQAEIDAACELIDFLKFNVQFAVDALRYKPTDVESHTVNSMQLRGLEGFVAAISPFNFTAIGANLCSAPALMGNTVIWKPSDTSMLASYVFYKILRQSGLPPGVINFVPCDGPLFGETITKSRDLAGVNFTGSVPTFKWLWRSVGQNLDTYRSFPRLSGECGGKNYHLVHPSADLKSAVYATLRSAFEYSGQKCSACSRLYVPESMWPEFRDSLVELMREVKIGSPVKFDTFTSAVIDEKSFDKIRSYIEYGKSNEKLKLLAGGKYDKTTGFYIYPTLFQTSDPNDSLMKDEIFGPVLTAYVYKDKQYSQVLNLVDQTTPFALTGAIFAQDEKVISETMSALRQSQGNLYINDKCTGAVVNQQPFGGARMSGTNDKPGGPNNVLRWASPMSIKRFNLNQASYKHASML